MGDGVDRELDRALAEPGPFVGCKGRSASVPFPREGGGDEAIGQPAPRYRWRLGSVIVKL